jgi:hypothetical protein
MKVTVFHASLGTAKRYEIGGNSELTMEEDSSAPLYPSSVYGLKSVIRDTEGIPVTYQKISRNGVELSDSASLSEHDDVKLIVDLEGGSPHCSVGSSFVCYFRCMCCFSGIDGDWKSCQWFCLKCGI